MLKRTARHALALIVIPFLTAALLTSAASASKHSYESPTMPFQAGGQNAGAEIERVATLRIWEAIQIVVGYATWWNAEQARIAAEEAARQAELARIAGYVRSQQYRPPAPRVNPPAPASAPRPAAPASSGGACGGATNGADQFIQRESGGSPTAANPSGAYGCYQIMPYVWAATCSDLGPEIGSSPAAQAACASRLPLSAWNL